MIPEGTILWEASAARREGLNLAKFLTFLSERGHSFHGYTDLWQWSVTDLPGFWSAIAAYFDLIMDGTPTAILTDDPMPRTRWFTGTKLNYAEHVLRHEFTGDPARTMLHHSSELRPMQTASWADIAGQVRKLATGLRGMGLGQGDRIVAYMPNLPETVIAMLATVAIGAIWSSAAPEFGAQTVIDRFGQIAPKLVFATNCYRYGPMISTAPPISTAFWRPCPRSNIWSCWTICPVPMPQTARQPLGRIWCRAPIFRRRISPLPA